MVSTKITSSKEENFLGYSHLKRGVNPLISFLQIQTRIPMV